MTLFVSLKRFIFRIEMGLLVGSLLFMLWVLCYVIYVTRHNYAIEFDKITIPEEGECSFLIDKTIGGSDLFLLFYNKPSPDELASSPIRGNVKARLRIDVMQNCSPWKISLTKECVIKEGKCCLELPNWIGKGDGVLKQISIKVIEGNIQNCGMLLSGGTFL